MYNNIKSLKQSLNKLKPLITLIKQETNASKLLSLLNTAIDLSTSILHSHPSYAENKNFYKLLSALYQLKIEQTPYFKSPSTTDEPSFTTYITLLNTMATYSSTALLISLMANENHTKHYEEQKQLWLKYLIVLSEKNKVRYFPGIITLFESIPKLYYYLLANVARLYFNQGVKYYDNKDYGKTKGILHEAENIVQTHYTSSNTLIMNEETITMFADTDESVKFYLMRSTVNQHIDRGIKAYEEAFFVEETPDRDAIHYAESEFRNALKDLDDVITNKTNIVDIELEAICYGYLGILVYKGDNQKQKGKTFCARAVQLGLSLMPKNVTNTRWYKTANEIYRIEKRLEEIKEQNEAYAFKEEIKNKYKDVFYDLEEHYPSKGKYESDFVKYVLEKYPYEGYVKISNVKEEYLNNQKKMLKVLMVKYAPDKYAKGTEEEKKKYVIVEEICKELTRMYNEKK